MKRFLYFLLVLVAIVTVAILVMVIYTANQDLVTRSNVLIQCLYTFVTTILVGLTLGTLYTTNRQMHQSVRPYIIPIDVELIDDRRNEFEFGLLNDGVGLALNIALKIINKKDSSVFFEAKYPRLSMTNNVLQYPLYAIRNAITDLKNDTNRIHPSEIFEADIFEEMKLIENYDKYYNIEFRIIYENIYGKKYKSSFEFEYDTECREYKLAKESVEDMKLFT